MDFHLAPQPRARELPAAFHRARRKSRHRRRFLHREAAEEPQLDDLCLLAVPQRKPFEGRIERHQVLGALLEHTRLLEQRDRTFAAASPLGMAFLGVMHEHSAHRARGGRKKMPAALPAIVALPNQLHPRLVDERGRLKRVAGALPAQISLGEIAKVAVEHGEQLLLRGAVAAGASRQKRIHVEVGGAVVHAASLRASGHRVESAGRARSSGGIRHRQLDLRLPGGQRTGVPERPHPTSIVPGITARQLAVSLTGLVGLFLFVQGPIWSHVWEADFAILWSYAPIPAVVLGLLIVNRTFSVGRLLLGSFLVALLKYVITATILVTLMALSPPPKPKPDLARSVVTSAPAAPRAPQAPASEPAPSVFDPATLGSLEVHVRNAGGAPVDGAWVAIVEGLEPFHFRGEHAPAEIRIGPSGFEPKVAILHPRQRIHFTTTDGAMHTVLATDEKRRPIVNAPVVGFLDLQIPHPPPIVLLRCAAHPEETGALLELKHPFAHRTGPGGFVVFDGVPAGIELRVGTIAQAEKTASAPARAIARERAQVTLELPTTLK